MSFEEWLARTAGVHRPGAAPASRVARRVVLPFLAFGLAWVWGSDHLLDALFADPATRLMLQSLKGSAFVLLSALLVYGLVRRAQAELLALQQATREQHDRLSHIVEVSPSLIYALKPDAARTGSWRVDFVGANVQRVTGYALADWAADPGFLRAHLHPEDREAYDRHQRQLETEGVLRHEYRFLHADGHYRWIADQLVLLRDAEGRPEQLIGAWLDVTERKQAELAVTESARRYRELFDINPVPMWVFDVETLAFRSVNAAAIAAYGYSREEFLSMSLRDIRPPHENDRFEARMRRVREAGAGFGVSGEWQHRRKDGSLLWVEISGHSFEQDGRLLRLVALRDVSDRHHAREQQALVAQVFHASKEGIFITDARNRFVSINRSFTKVTGYEQHEVLGRTPSLLKSGRQNNTFYQAMWAQIHAEGRWEGEIWNRRKTGEVYPEWLSISAIRDEEGRVQQYLGIFTETSARKATEERIRRLSYYDALTGLPNPQLLTDRLRMALAHATPAHEASLAVMHLNIDHFGGINEAYGQDFGDQLLQTIGARLAGAIGATDTVSRRGADDFIVLLPESDARAATPVALRLMDCVAEPIELAGRELRLSACVGIAVAPENGSEAAQLLQAAESALHQAKREGRATLRHFSFSTQTQVREAIAVEHDLRHAVARGELELHYQPQVDARSLAVIGAEALVRWRHPQWGLVGPSRFIPVAERSGLIGEIGHWVMVEALRQTSAWQAAGLAVVPVAVNLSLAQFRDPELKDKIIQALRASGQSAGLLELELTESIAMEASETTAATLEGLCRLGVHLSIDDFGTGYSSLSQLKRFAVERLKIDQSFVRGLLYDANDEAIVRSVIGLARSLNLRTVAEGVETDAQADFLREAGCDELQGYRFGRPMPAAEFAALLQHRPGDAGATLPQPFAPTAPVRLH